MKKIVLIFGLVMVLVGLLGNIAANNIFEEIIELENQAGRADARGPAFEPEYITALFEQGEFVAFFSRALLLFSGFLIFYAFVDEIQNFYNKQKGRNKEFENTIKHEETYEEFKKRKQKFREEQRKSNN